MQGTAMTGQPSRYTSRRTIVKPQKEIINVAAYCRVSKKIDEQASSIETQMESYRKIISEHPNWRLAGIYADKGITGTSTKKRVEFNRMIELVKEMAEHYDKMNLHIFHVDQDSIQHYPEIVLALQGTCFEDGIFLHYKMAKMFREDNVRYVYTGDLADQVLNLETFFYTKNTYKRIVKMSIKGVKNAVFHGKYDHYNWMFRGRYETGALKNLKKGGLMWNYFGAAGIYPYVRRRFLSMAKSVIAPGDYSKQFHRKAVLETVDPVIAEKIQRNGGNTDPKALFNEKTIHTLRSEIEQMPWYKKRTYIDENQQLGYELRILYVDLVRRIFINRELGQCNIGEYPLLEDMYPAFKQ